ncbi:MAG TPA: VOC family protein [Bryobacteraceae bacterium]|nr:VOC family protein [Bryobacteraceae bacterium]
MAKAASAVPAGLHTITPHLTVKGASDYIEFLKRALGAVEVDRAPGPGGKLMHATVQIGDSRFMLNDHMPEFGAPPIPEGVWPVALHLYVPDVDALFAQATAAGCQVTMPLADQFWGDRYGSLRDPFGFRWNVATRQEDLTLQEMMDRQQKAFGAA